MSISANLAEVLHRMNELLPHRQESDKLAIQDSINKETLENLSDVKDVDPAKVDDPGKGGDK